MIDKDEAKERYIMNGWEKGYIPTKMVPIYRRYLGKDWLLVKDCTREFIKTKDIRFLRYAACWCWVTIRFKTMYLIGKIMRYDK